MSLIVIDGLDGSGKSTQIELLHKRLSNMGVAVKTISFPDYDHPSSALIKMYLAGDFGDSPDDVNAFAASSFYAVDRYASYKKFWEKDYKKGTFIIAARYTTSNAIHQMAKLDESEWEDYLKWLYDYEFEKLGLPKPDKVIFLDMLPHISDMLLDSRYDKNGGKKDIHEKNKEYLKKCRKAAMYAADKLSWDIVRCCDETAPFSLEKISDDIFDTVKDFIK